MKALRYILYCLVIVAAAGLLIYQGFVADSLEPRDLIRGVLIIAAALVGMLRPMRRKKVSNKKVVYQKAYGEYIQNAFYDDPKLEKKFYNAVDDYNMGRFGAGVDKLNKLRGECQRTADIYAVTVFLALCCDAMADHEAAVKHYADAARIRDNSTLHSNMGMCFLRMGNYDEAETCYHRAIQSDGKNAYPWNNLAALYFKQGAYDQALEYAETAIELDPKMPQALSCAAICCALLGMEEEYQRYYRKAVANGYDGRKIKNAVKAMDPGL